VGDCCDSGEYCLIERPPVPKSNAIGQPRRSRCASKCKPSDWCGPRLCCGKGMRCKRKGNSFKCVLGSYP
jgi:hypothetical protein